MARVAGRFRRVEPRRRARAYMWGLLTPLAGKNGWTLAEAAGENTPDGMQRLLNRSAWDADAVRDDLRDYVAEHLGDADGVLIIDETGFLKKENQVRRRPTPVLRDRRTDRELPARGVPGVRVRARAMLRRALDAGLLARWVTADEAYGKDSKFRLWLQTQRMGYVLAVACNQKIPTDGGSARADELAAAAPAPAWKRRSCGAGAKGPRLFDWAVATLPDTGTAEHGFTRWLLIRRSITDPTELAYYLCYGPADTDDEELIRVAGTRWAVEECVQTAKGQVGLDDYQVRRYDAWYRHITLAMCAHAFLTVTAAKAERGAPPTGPASFPSASPRLDVSWHT